MVAITICSDFGTQKIKSRLLENSLTWHGPKDLSSVLSRWNISPNSEFQILASDQFISVAQSCPTLCDPMNRSTPSLPVHHQLLEFTQLMCIESVMPSSHLILCRPLLLLPPLPPSLRVFSNESALRMRWPKYLSFSLSVSSSNEHPGLISFRMD